MEALNLAKKANGGFVRDISFEEYKSSKEGDDYDNICKSIRRVFPCSYDDNALIDMYYTNQFLLQDIMELEIKKHVIAHLDRLVERCKCFGRVKLGDILIKDGIFRWFRESTKDYGLFHGEIAWFMSDADGGGIYDTSPISSMISDYMHEDCHENEEGSEELI